MLHPDVSASLAQVSPPSEQLGAPPILSICMYGADDSGHIKHEWMVDGSAADAVVGWQ